MDASDFPKCVTLFVLLSVFRKKINLLDVSNFTNFTYAKHVWIDSLQKNCGEIPMLTDKVIGVQRDKLDKFLYLEENWTEDQNTFGDRVIQWELLLLTCLLGIKKCDSWFYIQCSQLEILVRLSSIKSLVNMLNLVTNKKKIYIKKIKKVIFACSIEKSLKIKKMFKSSLNFSLASASN